MTQLILIRHGHTLWTEQKKYQGHSDTKLSQTGIQRIRELAKGFRRVKVDFLYAASLKRAVHSAQILAQGKLKLHLDSRICEMNFGKWEGRSAEELLRSKDKAFLAWTRKQNWPAPPGGESRAAFRRRVKTFFIECLRKHPGKTIAIVSHGGAIRLMILEALQLPFKFFFSFRIDPASVTIVSAHLEKPGRLSILNSSRFLEKME